MIDKDLILENAPSVTGTVRVNHTDCSAGTDTRRRLYITRKADHPDRLVAYCHNCGEAGYATDKDELRLAFGSKRPMPTATTWANYNDLEPISSEHPRYMAWPTSYGITFDEMESYGFRCDLDSGRLVLPIWSTVIRNATGRFQTGVLHGYQSRAVAGALSGPKYLTVKEKEHYNLETLILSYAPGVANCIVIVEDLLSAIKVSRVSKYTVPLYGTHIRSELVLDYTKLGPVVVWLDNDNEVVHSHAKRIVSLARAFGSKVARVENHKDPKCLRQSDLYDEVTKASRRAH